MQKNKIRILFLAGSLLFVFTILWKTFFIVGDIQALQIFNPRAQEFFNLQGFREFGVSSEVSSMYRNGNERNGSYEVPNLSLPLKVQWTLPDIFAGIHTASKATPAVDNSGIYIGTDLGIFYKVSHAGKVIWSFRTESSYQGIHGTALLDKDHIFFGNYAGDVYCLDKKTGALIWSTSVSDAAGSSPLLYKEKLILSSEFNNPHEGYMLALNEKSGKKEWVSDYFEEQVHSSPTLAIEENVLAVGANSGAFLGINPDSGETKWTYSGESPNKSTAVYHQGLFCFSSWDRRFHCVTARDGQETFSIDLEGLSQSSAALDEQRSEVYVSSASGYLYKINLKEKKLVSQVSLQMSGKTNRFSQPSPIFIKTKSVNYVLAPCEDTKICLFDARDLKLKQQLEVGGIVSGSFAVYDGGIYFSVNNQGLFGVR